MIFRSWAAGACSRRPSRITSSPCGGCLQSHPSARYKVTLVKWGKNNPHPVDEWGLKRSFKPVERPARVAGSRYARQPSARAKRPRTQTAYRSARPLTKTECRRRGVLGASAQSPGPLPESKPQARRPALPWRSLRRRSACGRNRGRDAWGA